MSHFLITFCPLVLRLSCESRSRPDERLLAETCGFLGMSRTNADHLRLVVSLVDGRVGVKRSDAAGLTNFD